MTYDSDRLLLFSYVRDVSEELSTTSTLVSYSHSDFMLKANKSPSVDDLHD